MLPGVTGDPARNLGQLTDADEESTAHLVAVRALAVHVHSTAKVAQGRPDEVSPGQHVVREPQSVHALLKVFNLSYADAKSSAPRQRGQRVLFGQEVGQ